MPDDTHDPLDDTILGEIVDPESSLEPEQTARSPATGNDADKRPISDSEGSDKRSGGFLRKLRSIFGSSVDD